MKTRLISAMAACMLAAIPAHAMAGGIGVEATGGKDQSRWGGEVGVGYDFGFGIVSVRPIAGVFVSKKDSRYYQDAAANNQCRDGNTGALTTGNQCSSGASFYGKLEAAVSIPAFVQVGVGLRYSHETVRPYGLIALPIAPMVKVTGQLGDRYGAAGIRFGF